MTHTAQKQLDDFYGQLEAQLFAPNHSLIHFEYLSGQKCVMNRKQHKHRGKLAFDSLTSTTQQLDAKRKQNKSVSNGSPSFHDYDSDQDDELKIKNSIVHYMDKERY